MVGAAKGSVDLVPPPVEELELVPEAQTEGGVLSVEVFDLGKCIFLMMSLPTLTPS